MKCLHCHHEMKTYEIHKFLHSISYNVCEECGSLWFDKGALDKLSVKTEGSIEYCSQDEIEAKAQPKECPSCGQSLHPVKFLGSGRIIADRCRTCFGFWIEGEQVEAVSEELLKIMPATGKIFTQFILNTHKPHFRHAKQENSLHPHAQTPHKAAETPACPVCQQPMPAEEKQGLHFYRCPTDSVIWLNKPAMHLLQKDLSQAAKGALSAEAAEEISGKLSALTCPDCDNTALIAVHFGPTEVIINRCPKCHGALINEKVLRSLPPEADYAPNDFTFSALSGHPTVIRFLATLRDLGHSLGAD